MVRNIGVMLERMFRLDDRREKNWRSRRGMKWYPWPRIRMIERAKKLAGKVDIDGVSKSNQNTDVYS